VAIELPSEDAYGEQRVRHQIRHAAPGPPNNRLQRTVRGAARR